MRIFERAALGGLALLACGLVAPSPGRAQTPAAAPAQVAPAVQPITPDAAEVAHKVVAAVDFQARIAGSSQASFGALFDQNPVWHGFALKAAAQSADDIIPAYEHIWARALMQRLTPQQLSAGAAFLRTDAGADLMRFLHEEYAGVKSPAPFSPTVLAALNQFRATPDGAAFVASLDSPDIMNATRTPLLVVWMPALFGRMGDAISADNDARAAAASPDTASDAVGIELAKIIFDASHLDRLMFTGQENALASLNMDPEWPALFKASFEEAATAARPKLDRIAGKALAAGFTQAELKAGVTFFRTPAGRKLLKGGFASYMGEPKPVLTRAEIIEANRFAATGAGKSFTVKFANVETILQPSQNEMIGVLVVEAFRVFSQRATTTAMARALAS